MSGAGGIQSNSTLHRTVSQVCWKGGSIMGKQHRAVLPWPG